MHLMIIFRVVELYSYLTSSASGSDGWSDSQAFSMVGLISGMMSDPSVDSITCLRCLGVNLARMEDDGSVADASLGAVPSRSIVACPPAVESRIGRISGEAGLDDSGRRAAGCELGRGERRPEFGSR